LLISFVCFSYLPQEGVLSDEVTSPVLSCAGMFKQGCSAFRVVTPNIDEEAAMMEDVGMQDVHFNEVMIVFMCILYIFGSVKAK